MPQGTDLFMAAEVASGAYNFVPEDMEQPMWTHNALHDVESIWWIALWAIFTFRPETVKPQRSDADNFFSLFNGDAHSV